MHSKSHPEHNEDDSDKSKAFPCNLAIRQRLMEFRKVNGGALTDAELGQKIGCSPAILSQWLSPKGNLYTADISKWERRAEDFIKNDARRRASGVETTDCETAQQMRTALELIRKTNDVGMIMAEAGHGKTRGAELYHKENPTSLLYSVKSWACDKASIEGALFDAVGFAGYDNRTKRAVFLANKLTGSDRLLNVDDAHKLTRPALQWLFDFADETQIPLALTGTFDLEDKIADDAQRFSRVGLRYEIIPAEPRKLIEHLINTHAPNANGSFDELVSLCEQVVAEHGHYRSAHKQLKLAAELKEASKKPIGWPEAFRQAHTQLVRKYKLA
jgi:DNA transposition AAA+ family ATPase